MSASTPVRGTDRLEDRAAIVAVSISYAAGIDHRDWDRYRDIFTDRCEFDFSSFSGNPASFMTNQQWADNVRSLNGNFDATQHIMTNHDITFTGEHAAVGINELQAQHFFTAATMESFGREPVAAWCLLGGHYTNTYVRRDNGTPWQITRCQLEGRWRTGDETIFALARQRGLAG